MTQADPNMAEGRWLWRRLYVFAFSLGVWVLMDRAIARIEPADLPRAVQALATIQAMAAVLYLVAPSAQQIAGVIAQLRPRLGQGGAA